jgi:hypothetical protein
MGPRNLSGHFSTDYLFLVIPELEMLSFQLVVFFLFFLLLLHGEVELFCVFPAFVNLLLEGDGLSKCEGDQLRQFLVSSGIALHCQLGPAKRAHTVLTESYMCLDAVIAEPMRAFEEGGVIEQSIAEVATERLVHFLVLWQIDG